ncbi:hypothetical protein [Streptomyces sp. NBC_00083]|uniref:hypothetical protein n=1 Tax=Streptomyces sp. NBC_00083 TaxID=2975647 RepID=UPI00224F6BA5|nr:hypothetical protein [Streptomyces sp. NBC_00083]MCX5386988.1 hypothetical protein [Streptomyces sp. NBC_00083]
MTDTRERSEGSAASLPSPLRPRSVLLGFAPWIIFDVIAGPSTWKLAAFTAFVAALVFSVPDFRDHRVKLLDAVGILFFGVVALLGCFLDRHDLIWLETYAQVLSSGVLALIALVSLVTVPFTEQYARESVPREFWKNPRFRRTNRIITAAWAVVFVATALLGLAALHTKSMGDWYNWVIPVILLVLAIKFTKWYPAQVRAQGERAGGVR